MIADDTNNRKHAHDTTIEKHSNENKTKKTLQLYKNFPNHLITK